MCEKEQCFEVWTQNESGFVDYHEENDETSDFGIALSWLRANDCIGGHIKLDGKIIVSKDCDGALHFESGWGGRGLMALVH